MAPVVVHSVDVPQADSLSAVREMVATVGAGARTLAAIRARSAASPRQIAYRLHAARVLRLIEEDDGDWNVTELGARLLTTAPHSLTETTVFREAIASSELIRRIAPALLEEQGPAENKLAKRITSLTGLSPTTAKRRAGTLLRWRAKILARQAALFDNYSGPVKTGAELFEHHAPTMLTDVRLLDFKGYRDASLTLGYVTLLVGTNASGKSNVRDAFRFLHGISRGYTLAEIIGEKWVEGGVLQWRGIRGGTREVTFRGQSRFALEASFRVRDGNKYRSAKYLIEVDVNQNGKPPRVARERLVILGRGQHVFDSHPEKNAPTQDDPLHLSVRLRKPRQSGFYGPTVSVINNRPALSQLRDHPDVKNDEVREHIELAFSAFRSMRFLDLSPQAMRNPSIPGQTVLGDRGENLSSVLQAICDDPSRKQALLHWIRELTPMDAADFRFPTDATGRVLLALVEENGHQTTAYSASDGTLRFLAIVAALLGPEPVGLYFLEELENGIHPTRLHLLLGLIERQTELRRCQVVATSHSPQLLAFLSPESRENAALTYRLPNEPEAQIRRIMDIPDAKRVIADHDLARLHASGWLEDAVDFAQDESDK